MIRKSGGYKRPAPSLRSYFEGLLLRQRRTFSTADLRKNERCQPLFVGGREQDCFAEALKLVCCMPIMMYGISNKE